MYVCHGKSSPSRVVCISVCLSRYDDEDDDDYDDNEDDMMLMMMMMMPLLVRIRIGGANNGPRRQ